jgi:hypothetical protein
MPADLTGDRSAPRSAPGPTQTATAHRSRPRSLSPRMAERRESRGIRSLSIIDQRGQLIVDSYDALTSTEIGMIPCDHLYQVTPSPL